MFQSKILRMDFFSPLNAKLKYSTATLLWALYEFALFLLSLHLI